jgi:hypothetical protein
MIEKHFTFIVGDIHHNCPWFVADFLSPKIASFHSVDSSIDEFVIKTKDSENKFHEIISLGSGLSVCVNDMNGSFFTSIASELCNWELYFSVKGR